MEGLPVPPDTIDLTVVTAGTFGAPRPLPLS